MMTTREVNDTLTDLLNATTVSCSGKDITIQCNDHDIKDALMDFLTDTAFKEPIPNRAAIDTAVIDRCQQIAGKALGYPWFKDDPKNFPNATEADGVCIGEHVEETIVQELADAYLKLRALTTRASTAHCEWCGSSVVEREANRAAPDADTITPGNLAGRIEQLMRDYPYEIGWSDTFRRSEWATILDALTNRAGTIPREQAHRMVYDLIAAVADFEFSAPSEAAERRVIMERSRDALVEALSYSPENVPGWRPIETGPKDGTRVLAYDPESCARLVIFWNASWREAWGGEVNKCVTHWMPLPDIPAITSG